MNLFEIREEILALESIDAEGEESLEEALKNSLDELGLDLNDKVDNICRLLESIDGDIDTIKTEEVRLANRRKTHSKRKEGIKSYLLDTLQALGKKKHSTALFSITDKIGREVVVIDEGAEIDKEFMVAKTVITPDKRALLAALKDHEMSGCHLERNKNTLQIK